MSLTVTIGRGTFSLPDMVISSYPAPTTPWWLPEDGIADPAWVYRTTYAPESAYVPGQRALAAVLDASSLPLVVYVRKTDSATLGTVKAVLEVAVSQWAYDITVDVDGSSRTYKADPCWPQWGPVDSGMAAEGIARAEINVPVNPPESTA